MVIDFHTHIFPDKIAERTIQILKNNIVTVNGGDEPPAYTDATVAGLEASMEKNKIDLSVVMPIATTVTQSGSINRFAAEVNGRGKLYSFGSVHPMQENVEQELERIKGLGLLGIKLHPEYQGFYVDSPEGMRVLRCASELGLLVLYHAGRDIGMKPPVHCMPDRLYRAWEAVPGARIIAAHMGGWMVWGEVERYLMDTDIYFDTSFSIPFMREGQFERMVQRHGADKILFGTDSPWDDQGASVQQVMRLELSQEALDKIMYQNDQGLLEIS